MEDLEGKIVELVGKFEQLAVNIAPDALELGLFVARVAAAQQAILMILGIGFALWGLPRGLGWLIYGGDKEDMPLGMMRFIFGFFGAVLGGVNLGLWPFVGIFYPEAWIAKEVLGL